MSDDLARKSMPPFTSRERTWLSDWVALETISVARAGSPQTVDIFHAFQQADYVHILPMTSMGEFVLVRQYRPVVESWTLEFPGGLRNTGERPEATAARELQEETGFAALELVPLIECHADVGRLSNRFYGFFAIVEHVAEAEPGINPILLSGQEVKESAVGGRIASANHIALLYLAAVNSDVQNLCRKYGHATATWT